MLLPHNLKEFGNQYLSSQEKRIILHAFPPVLNSFQGFRKWEECFLFCFYFSLVCLLLLCRGAHFWLMCLSTAQALPKVSHREIHRADNQCLCHWQREMCSLFSSTFISARLPIQQCKEATRQRRHFEQFRWFFKEVICSDWWLNSHDSILMPETGRIYIDLPAVQCRGILEKKLNKALIFSTFFYIILT